MAIQTNCSTATTCPYCGVGCGVNVPTTVKQDSGIAIPLQPVSGLADHPANQGKLCVKGSSLHETLTLQGRLLDPMVKGKKSSWPHAIETVAQAIDKVMREYGPQAIAFYGSGQLLTEDYYVANKLIKGFLGSANIDTNSRLCMASAVVGYKKAFGSDTVPTCYDDIDHSDLIVMIGSNAAWAHPILYQRMVSAKQNNPNMKVVVIDPRATASCDIADLHLAIKPGSDGYLFNGLLAYLAQHDFLDQEYIDNFTQGFNPALQMAAQQCPDIATTAELCGIKANDLKTFYSLFAHTEKTLSFYSQGINQSESGVDKCSAIINCHLATGRIGKAGAGPFSITGQPNAMGGREVGGLANQLAAHMDFNNPEDIDRVKRFWNATHMAEKEGLKAVDLFNAIEAGQIKFLWIMSTNPLVSMPEADRLKLALEKCEMVVVSDCQKETDTTKVADVLLPAAGWGEKNGTVTNSERRISRQRNFLPTAGNSKPDWWIITQVAKKLGFSDAFPYQHPYEIFNEHAALSAFENGDNGHRKRDFDLSGLTRLTQQQYDNLQPIQWPVNQQYPNGRQRMFDDGEFFTPEKTARFIPISARYPVLKKSKSLPFIMNTGRVRDQWHTMTRTGKTDRLLQHISEPYLDIHPHDAAQLQLKEDTIARVHNPNGEVLARVKITTQQRAGEVFVPMHWTGQFSSKGRMGVLVNSITDPISGQPESKHVPVAIEKYPAAWFGFLLLTQQAAEPDCDYWAKIPFEHGNYYELAGNQDIQCAVNQLSELLPQGSELRFFDPSQGRYRIAILQDKKLTGVLFLSQHFDLPNRRWLCAIFNQNDISDFQRRALLAGQEGNAAADPGKIVCSCFQIGDKQIGNAIAAGHNTVEALGASLKCGTNCGSCIPEIKKLVDQSDTMNTVKLAAS